MTSSTTSAPAAEPLPPHAALPPRLLASGLLPHGCVYLLCPERDAAVRGRDSRHRLGFNTVVFWPRATRWDAAEPGGLAFYSIDHALDRCVELGLSAVFELQGQDDNHGPVPEWLSFAHEWPKISDWFRLQQRGAANPARTWGARYSSASDPARATIGVPIVR